MIDRMIFQHQEVFGGGGAVDIGQAADGRAGHVHRHRDAVFLRQVADLLGFQNAAGSGQIGVDDADRALLRAAA